MAKLLKKTNIFLFIPFILGLSLIADIILSFIIVKLDLQLSNSNYFNLLPFASAIFAALISYISMNRIIKDKIIFSIAIFLMALLVAYPTMIISVAGISISDACARQAPHPCLL